MGTRELRAAQVNLSPEQQNEIVRARLLAEKEKPRIKERVRLLDEAAGEQTWSGTLRRAIHVSGIDLDLLSQRTGIDIIQLDEFLTGERTLRSDAIDRIAISLGAKMTISSPSPIPIIDTLATGREPRGILLD